MSLKVIAFVWVVVTSALYAFALVKAAPQHDVVALLAFPLLFGGMFVTAFVHEAGHLIAGLASGWRPIVFAVRPFGFQFPVRGFAIMPDDLVMDARGWVVMVPRDAAMATRRNVAIYRAGGPIASFALAAIALGGAAIWLGTGSIAVGIFALAIGGQALHDVFFTLLPDPRPDGRSDGDGLRELWRGRHAPYRVPLALYVNVLTAFDVRLRETPQWMIDDARDAEPADSTVRQWLDRVEIGKILDAATVDVPRARTLIDRCRAAQGDSEWLASCDSWLAAVWENDPERAALALWSGAVTTEMRPLGLAAEAAVAARLGKIVEAHVLLRELDRTRKGRTRFRDAMYDDISRTIADLIPTPRA